MQEAGVVEPANTAWASPILFVPKKNGFLRICVDYRRHNAVTECDSYPIPRRNDCIDSLGETQIFLILDANSEFWQLEMDEKDIDKTAFVTHHGLFKCTRMRFGLMNASAMFQPAMDVILASV